MRIEYLEDSKVDVALDAELRALLASCFTGESGVTFSHQRFYLEMPAHRWMVRDGEGRLAAHLALHDKVIGALAGDLRVGGIAEVCVAMEHRGQGLVRRLLAESDNWMANQRMPFGALLGDPRIYGSSGYRGVDNPIRHLVLKTGAWQVEPMTCFLVKPIGSQPWPEGEIDLRGPIF